MNSLAQLLENLESHLESLREAGIREVEITRDLPVRPAVRPPREAPARPIRPSPATGVPPRPNPPPPPAAKPAQPKAATTNVVWARVERLPECGDGVSPSETALVVVCEARDVGGELLNNMLRAMGYASPEAPQPLASPEDLQGRGARVVCFGSNAHDAACVHGMGLSLVRGQWQKHPAGRMISTYGPGYLEGHPEGKRTVWRDLQQVLSDLGLSLPPWVKGGRASS